MACYKCRITRRKVNQLEQKVEQIELDGGLSSKQDNLVSGQNIKTINGNSILGEGNLSITSYRTFNSGWNTSSILQLCQSIIADNTAEAGMVYYGKFTGSGLPNPLGQAEMIIEIIADDGANGKSLHLNVFSADTSPYKWEAQYVKINSSYPQNISWKAYALESELNALETDMNNKISAAYHHAGTKTVAQLTASLLTAEHVGEVYNIIDSGTTTSNFLEGQGLQIREGDNVGIARIVNGNNTTYKFDLLSGFVDTTNFVQKSNTVGLIKNDGTIDTNVYLTSHQDISNLVASTSVRNIVVLTQEQYDALVEDDDIDPNTEYNIIEL